MTTNNCPLCGAPTNWRELLSQRDQRSDEGAWRPWEKRRYSPFGIGDVSAIPAGMEYERRRPVRNPTLESDVLTPVLQTAFTGAIGAAIGGAAAAIAAQPRPWAFALGAGAVALAATWAALLTDHRRLLWEIERITGQDFDGDGVSGDPVHVEVEPEPRVTRVEVTEKRANGNTRIRYTDLPVKDSELEAIARAVLERREPFSQRGLGNVLSQEQYSETYERMIDAGLLRYRGKSARAGVELTGSGRAFLSQYLD